MSTQLTGIHRADQRARNSQRSHPSNILHKSIALAGWMFALPFNLSGLVIDRISSLIPSTSDDDLPSAWGYKNRGGVVKRTPVVYGDSPIERLRERQLSDAQTSKHFSDYELEQFMDEHGLALYVSRLRLPRSGDQRADQRARAKHIARTESDRAAKLAEPYCSADEGCGVESEKPVEPTDERIRRFLKID